MKAPQQPKTYAEQIAQLFLEVIFLPAFLIAVPSLLAASFYLPYAYKQKMKQEYAAWVKLTGNPSKLTLEEFINLPRRYK